MPRSDINRGEVWELDSSSGQALPAESFVLVVQTNPANHNPRYPHTIVVTVSAHGLGVPFHVRLAPDTALPGEAFVRCEQIATVSKERLSRRMAQLGPEVMEKVAEGLRLVLAC